MRDGNIISHSSISLKIVAPRILNSRFYTETRSMSTRKLRLDNNATV